jgi:hypothetical protein
MFIVASAWSADVPTYCDLTTKICKVPSASMTALTNDSVIKRVILEAERYGAHEIIFPSGTFKLSNSIIFNDIQNGYKLNVSGAGIVKTIIQPEIPNSPTKPSVPFFPVFNITGKVIRPEFTITIK